MTVFSLETRRWTRPLSNLSRIISLPFIFAICFCSCATEYPQSTIDPATGDLGAAVQDLYFMVFWWTMVILVIVWSVLGYVLVRYRARPGDETLRVLRGNLMLEMGWTGAAALIVILIAIPTIQGVFRSQAPPGADALVVELVGHQWWWEFRYPDQEVVTANELHLPVGRTVDLRMHSADVIHSFWVPRFGGKRDVNPLVRKPKGDQPRRNRLAFTVDEPGVYYGQCAEYCGSSHAYMATRVVVEAPDEFEAWLQRMRTPAAPDSGSLADQGRQIFMGSTCVACHAIEGTNAGGTLGPSLTRLGARATIGAGILENTSENLVAWIRRPADFKPGVKMPGVTEGGGGFPPTGLSEEQLGAVAAYLSSTE